MEFHSQLWEHLHIFICFTFDKTEVLGEYAQRKRYPVTFQECVYVEFYAKLQFNFIKLLRRNENADFFFI